METIIDIYNIIHIIITVILFMDIGYLLKYRKSYLPATIILLTGIYTKAYLYYKEEKKFTNRIIIFLTIGTLLFMYTIFRIKTRNIII